MKIYPLPEALDGEPWTVGAGSGCIDTKSRIIHVPLDDSDHCRFIRNHELGHARITPKQHSSKLCIKHGVSMRALQVCEDLRVHLFLRKQGVEMTGGLTESEMNLAVLGFVRSEREVAAALLGTSHTGDQERVMQALQNHMLEEKLADIVRRVQFVVVRLANGRYLTSPRGFAAATVPAARLFDSLFPENGDSVNLPFRDIISKKLIRGTRKGVRWGTMTVHRLGLENLRKVSRIAHTKTFTDEGSILTAPHRYCVDGRVFGRKKRTVGGTVLIDGSGSMSLSDHDLEDLVSTAPASVIAIYSGYTTRGQLTVIAANGRVATQEGLAMGRACGSGNIVDGPALEWLAKQKPPRIWVSDGCVTGIHDNMSIDLMADAELLCRRGGIRRVGTTKEASRVLYTLSGRLCRV